MTAATARRAAPEPLADIARVERFLYLEARLLDERRFEDWETLFTEDGTYWVPARPDQPDPWSEVSIFHDDRALRRTRIERLRHPDIHVEDPPPRNLRLVSNVRLDDPSAPGVVTATSSLVVIEYRQGRQRLFGGLVTHDLVPHGDAFLIRRKKVVLLDADGTFEALTVPF